MYTLYNLERGVTYEIRLWAINVNGTGPPTEWYEIDTYENDLDESRHPDAPSPLRGKIIDDCFVLLFLKCFNNFAVRTASDKILVGWSPPQNQNIKIRNYILGWGKGIPDMYSRELDEKERSYLIEHLGMYVMW